MDSNISSHANHGAGEALYRTMVRTRAFENAAETASQGGVSAYGQQAAGAAKVRGPLHLSTGQEAVPAGVCAHLRASDYLTSTHRGHGHTLAKGADLTRMMCELFGKATGFNGGKGGSMHIADFSVGMLGANGVVAAGLPIAVGAAHAQKLLKKRDDITVCFFGDGAINRGPFLEALNWARVYELPVLFVCEDNRWSATTASGPMTAGEGASVRAEALGIGATQVDGNDVFAVHAAAAKLVAEVRAGVGPRLLHALTYRVKGHVSVDVAAYRDAAELAAALETDPIARARGHLLAVGVAAATLDAIENAARDEVDTALAVADAAPWPEATAAFTDVQTVGEGQWR
ncbi:MULTISPECIES: thiamine pyrophosphate-dependent dehydrogenase E1 component subunit alpha [unclassified Variovorax]|jgi:pyruvate dehydrogenase E1 component alpha subunit|uniref:thiamine pyrophosphate-dependent dehydrogenase E1 component subunit alpha n=1 Tax=unclassified Variovorax TaxID=663243 RepID=UPI000F7F61C6|nr:MULTISPECIES: thiamine pyrophosphate-dependent dehydrogenase E1 component subunit alpha [unclassified Variovorax]RSZ38528.1 thiamine pyrophosphate-dependent dehydrogenase E1 component subunit alpha [Variovorax sp. 553]RSZ39021.1 thiamine pyrophosphate-dependent dehydrogenase E1 component subunit alpha [Variovorax sp. 679]